MGQAITIMKPVSPGDDTFLIDCAVDHLTESIKDTGGTATPSGGVVAVGCTTLVVRRGRTRIGAVSGIEVPRQGIAVKTIYLEPGWRGQGLLGPVMTELKRKADESGLPVFLRGPVDARVERVGRRLGMVVGFEDDDSPEKARVREGDRWMLDRMYARCGHVKTVCAACASAFFRRELTQGGMYAAMRADWVVGRSRIG